MRQRFAAVGVLLLLGVGLLWLAGDTARRSRTTEFEEPVLAPQITTARPISMADPRRAALANQRIPSPTEIADWRADRKERRRQRQQWIESLHRVPPHVDWRAIEAANRRALSLERFARIAGGQRTDDWAELGSVNLAGRTHAAFPSSDGQHLYVGSNLGGVWRGTIDGTDWVPLSDGLGLGSHTLLVVPPGVGPDQPEMLFTATTPGPGQGGDPTIYASADGGLTWFVPAGLPEYIYEPVRILHDAAHPRTVFLLIRGGQWVGDQYQAGWLISRSTDGGFTFELRFIQIGFQPRCDLWIDRLAGGPLYLMSGNTLYISHDQALTFTEVGSAPVGTVSDVVLTASEAGPPTFYAALEEAGSWDLYRSTDGGVNWSWRHDIHDFWKTLLASITDADLIFFAGVECWRSADGGSNFAKINNWWDYYGDPAHRLHADLPGMDAHMVEGEEAIYFNTDGGTYVSFDGGATVQNLSLWGLAISQYYGIFTSHNDPYLVAAGSQDQGYQQSTPGGRAAYLPFEQLISGDYGHLTSTVRDHNWLYSVYPGFVLLQVSETPPQHLFQIDFPACSHTWMPFILADPHDPDVFYFCGDHLWRYERNAPSYSYTMEELPQFFGYGSGATALGISAADQDYRYVATGNGNLWYSWDAGANWTISDDHGPSSHYFYGTAIAISASDPRVAYVGGSGYLGHPVWKTTDGGVTWEGMGQGLPSTLVYGLALGGDEGQTLFAACEAGPHMFDAERQEWINVLGTEAPLTIYWCVEWVPEIGVARFGTYGRGIWDYTPPSASDIADRSVDAARAGTGIVLTASPNPTRDGATLRFALRSAGEVRLELFDVAGRRVALVADRLFIAGEHELSLDLRAHRLTPGFYLARISSPEGVDVRKLQLVD